MDLSLIQSKIYEIRGQRIMLDFDLAEMYPGTDPRGITLLTRMLEFNPNKRINASEAITD